MGRKRTLLMVSDTATAMAAYDDTIRRAFAITTATTTTTTTTTEWCIEGIIIEQDQRIDWNAMINSQTGLAVVMAIISCEEPHKIERLSALEVMR